MMFLSSALDMPFFLVGMWILAWFYRWCMVVFVIAQVDMCDLLPSWVYYGRGWIEHGDMNFCGRSLYGYVFFELRLRIDV